MKKYLFLFIAICISQLMALNVSATKPQPYVPTNDYGKCTATDGSGNVYVAGKFSSSSITFGTITLTLVGTVNIFIVKYDANGNVLWAKSALGSINDIRGIATDSNGNVYLTGYFTSFSITFDTITLTDAGNGKGNMFIVKYDASGNVLWAQGTGGCSGQGIVTEGSEYVYVTGAFGSTAITFETLTGTTTLTTAGYTDIFIVKYNTNGSVLWAKSAGGSGTEVPCPGGITTDGIGNVYVTGPFNSPSITFGTTTLINVGQDDIFIVKYDANGNVVWATSGGGSSYEAPFGIATDEIGNVYITGDFLSASITFGTFTLINAGGGYDDMFIVKYDASGTVLWAKRAGGINQEIGKDVATDGSGNVYVTGIFAGSSITFGTTTLTNAKSGYNDIFIVKYGAIGNVLWAKRAGGTNSDYPSGIATDVIGNAFVTGYFTSSSITFGTITLTNTTGSKGDGDVFIAKYDGNGNVPWAKCAGLSALKISNLGTNDPSGNLADGPDGNGAISADGQETFILQQNYPNPFQGSTSVIIDKANSGVMKLSLYDVSGRKLAEYQGVFEQGYHSFKISCSGNKVLCLVVSDGKTSKSIKMICTGQSAEGSTISYNGQANPNGKGSTSVPTVTTTPVTNITPTTATSGGTISAGGNVQITARGVCWNTSPGPTISNNHTTDGSGTGTFVSSLTGLITNTLSYVRAYATSNSGTVYGNEVSFITASVFECGSSFTITHLVSGGVAPVNKTVTYGTVTNIPGEPSKCWITSNLGADHQATAVNDSTEASAGWYWQFNRKQGYKFSDDGKTRTPRSKWVNRIAEDFDWQASNDPCALELGNGWRLPTYTEWSNVDSLGNWADWNGPWNSGLKIHAAGGLYFVDGSLFGRGATGRYWSSSTMPNSIYTQGGSMFFYNNRCLPAYQPKAYGFSVRCIKDPQQ